MPVFATALAPFLPRVRTEAPRSLIVPMAVATPVPLERNWVEALSASGTEREDAVGGPARAPAARGPLRDRRRRRGPLARARRGARRPRHPGGRRRADGRPRQARRLPRRSRFTTWAYKFALLEAGVQAAPARVAGPRGRARARGWPAFADAARRPHERARGRRAAARAAGDAIDEALTPHQREVFVALALNEVPIDVLAERLGHDPRRALQDPARRRAQAARASWPTAGATRWQEVRP